MTISSFDKSNLPQIRKALEAALKTVEDQFGITLRVGNVRFDSHSFRSALEATVNAPSGVAITPEQLALEREGRFMLSSGFDISKTYKHPRLGDVKLDGLRTRSRDYPFIVQQLSTGKRFKFSIDDVENLAK